MVIKGHLECLICHTWDSCLGHKARARSMRVQAVLLETSLKGAAGCRVAAWVGIGVPFGKLQEADHFLWGVDISQRVVWVHQYQPPDDKTLREEGKFLI